jgi:biopolymer transport protein ExbD
MAFGGSNGQPEMNVTPMIDILLVLIIVFMIIVPTGRKGLIADIPQEAKTDSRTPPPDTAIVIQLHGAGCNAYDEKSGAKTCQPTLTINQQPVKWEELHDRLFDIYKQRAERVAFVKADNDLEFDPVAQVIDIAHAAGVVNVGLMK